MRDRTRTRPQKDNDSDRPAIMSDRLCNGDCEVDPVGLLESSGDYGGTHVEYTLLGAVPHKQARAVVEAMTSLLAPLKNLSSLLPFTTSRNSQPMRTSPKPYEPMSTLHTPTLCGNGGPMRARTD